MFKFSLFFASLKLCQTLWILLLRNSCDHSMCLSLRQAQMCLHAFFSICAYQRVLMTLIYNTFFFTFSSLYVVTWNVSQKYPDHITLSDLLDIDTGLDKSLPDVYIMGLQEVNANPQNIVTNLFKADPVRKLWTLYEKIFAEVVTLLFNKCLFWN